MEKVACERREGESGMLGEGRSEWRVRGERKGGMHDENKMEGEKNERLVQGKMRMKERMGRESRRMA